MKVQLEMLQMDLEDNETAMNSFDSQVEELKATIESLEVQLEQNQTQMSHMEVRLEDSKAQVDPISECVLVMSGLFTCQKNPSVLLLLCT